MFKAFVCHPVLERDVKDYGLNEERQISERYGLLTEGFSDSRELFPNEAAIGVSVVEMPVTPTLRPNIT